MCVGQHSLPCEYIILGFEVTGEQGYIKMCFILVFLPDCSGKLFGTEADYLVAEAEFQEGAGEEAGEEEEEAGGEGGGEEGGGEGEGEDGGSEEEKDEPPKSQWKPPPVVPKEDPKTGANKKTYFVCNQRE